MSADPVARTYDELPYDSRPRYATHPECLAVAGLLKGVAVAPVAECRYLEIGCASGGNLLPLADAYPNGTFVGIDVSERQIDTGRKVASRLGLTNLTLRHGDLAAVADERPFDYVVAHGVYSWVDADVRDRLLATARAVLAPHGVAYVSYNVLPGWYQRAPIREMMRRRVRGIGDPKGRVSAARELLEFLVAQTAAQDSTYARMLRDEADMIRPEGDFYVAHEHLSADNYACWFSDFAAHAASHGLAYLGEAQPPFGVPGLRGELRAEVTRRASDPVGREQLTDDLIGRTFRRTLLVRDDVTLADPKPEAVADFAVSGLARPVSDSPDVRGESIEEFANDDGVATETNLPLAKALLMTLHERRPEQIPFAELARLCVERMGFSPSSLTGPVYLMLARSLIHLHGFGLAALHVGPRLFATRVSERPRASALARLQAEHNEKVTNRRHRQVVPSDLERAVLRLLDGSRGAGEIAEELARRGAKAEGGTMDGAVRSALENLAGMGVLIA